MRLIDADALKEKLQAGHDFYVNAWGGFKNLPANDKARVDELTASIAAVVNAPTIDAMPVVHARWVKDKGSYTYCSHCNAYLPAIEVCEVFMDDELYYNQEIEETNYCPNCGAKMDLED